MTLIILIVLASAFLSWRMIAELSEASESRPRLFELWDNGQDHFLWWWGTDKLLLCARGGMYPLPGDYVVAEGELFLATACRAGIDAHWIRVTPMGSVDLESNQARIKNAIWYRRSALDVTGWQTIKPQ